jgi:lysozyme
VSVNNYTYGKDGTALTEDFESCRLTAYQDVKGIWTIGWGHTGPDVHEGLVWTQAQADAAQLADVQTAQNCANNIITIPISQNENDAVVDWIYNVGCGAAEGSTLIRDLNAGQIESAAAQFDAWDHASGKVVAGLLRRRQAETELFDVV